MDASDGKEPESKDSILVDSGESSPINQVIQNLLSSRKISNLITIWCNLLMEPFYLLVKRKEKCS